MTTHVQIEQLDEKVIALETISDGQTTGHSVLMPPSEAAMIVCELLAIPAVDRAYQSLRDRSGASHEARASRR
jgi:hypothetical protein